jgi:hypothetical protein
MYPARRFDVRSAAVVGRHLAIALLDSIEGALAGLLTWLSWRRRRDLAARDRQRPEGTRGWFTPGESRLVECLAALIVPSDDAAPGAHEADVVTRLDRLLARSRTRQPLYARGLLGFDELARRGHGCPFVALTPDQQMALLKRVDTMLHGPAATPSLTSRLIRRAAMVYQQWRMPALVLFPRFREDVLGAFYSSPVAHRWLGYDGPPMPLGYPHLRPRDLDDAVTW